MIRLAEKLPETKDINKLFTLLHYGEDSVRHKKSVAGDVERVEFVIV